MSDARAAMERFMRWTFAEEPAALEPRLDPDEWKAFHDYYRLQPDPADAGAVAHYLRGFWRSEAGFALRWLAARERPRVLDAGSGFGTYAMVYALAGGADVVGADLRPDRLSVAEKRAALYREHVGGALPVRYLRCDLTREWPDDFDLVWVYNALSHIHPLGDFLAQVRRHLRPGGVLVIGDINGAFLPHRRRLDRAREQVYSEYVAPDGQRHTYAVEKTFGPDEMRAAMTSNGLRVIRHELYWGGLGAAGDALYHGVIAPIGRLVWLGTAVARRQLMVAGVSEGGR